MTSRHLRSIVLPTSAAFLFGAASVFAQTPSFVTFDAPNAGTGVGEGTVGASINAHGVIAGYYIDSSDMSHGFVRDATGTITEFDPPNMTQTTVQSINKLGQITGFASTNHGNTQGFLRKVNGNFVHIAVPGSLFTQPWRINDGGVITGLYGDAGSVVHGFTFAAGTYTTFDDPDAALSVGFGTRATAINVGNVVVGYYDDNSTGSPRIFVRDTAGNFGNFDAVPGGSSGVFPVAINLAGQIAGTYYNSDGVSHSFIRDSSGNITTFVVTGATGTRAVDMNDSGIIVGQWTNNVFNTQGFLRSSGGVTTFSAPLPNGGTFPYAINNSGRITGSYYNPSQVGFHGFVR
jgi:hypothetical protein